MMMGGPGNIFGVVPPQPGVTREDVERNGRERDREMAMMNAQGGGSGTYGQQQQQQQQQSMGQLSREDRDRDLAMQQQQLGQSHPQQLSSLPSATLTIQGGSQVLPRELVASLQASGINISAPGEQQQVMQQQHSIQQQQQQQSSFHPSHRNSTGLLGLGPIPSSIDSRSSSFSHPSSSTTNSSSSLPQSSSSSMAPPSSNAALNKKFQASQASSYGGLSMSPRPAAAMGVNVQTGNVGLEALSLGPQGSASASASAAPGASGEKDLRDYDRLREHTSSPEPNLSPAYASLGLGPAASAAAAEQSQEREVEREAFRESTDQMKIRILDLVDEVAAAHYQRAMEDQAVAMANGQTFKALSATLHSTGVSLQQTRHALAIYSGEESAIASLQLPALDALTAHLQNVMALVATAKAKLLSESPSGSSSSASSPSGTPGSPSSSTPDHSAAGAAAICSSCQADRVATVIWPCAHRVLCNGCRPENCPSCQATTQRVIALQDSLPQVSQLLSGTPSVSPSGAGSSPSISPSPSAQALGKTSPTAAAANAASAPAGATSPTNSQSQ
jgi:hypothetical protein